MKREYSHQVKADHISPQTHLKLSQPWIRKKLLEWQKDKYPKGIPEWWTPEEAQTLGEKSELNPSSNGMLFFKPQIPIWDRIKGIPMRTAMTVLKEIFEYKDFTPTWPENSIKHKGSCLVWVTFNSSKGIAKVHIDQSIDFEIFVEAFQSKFANSSTQGKAQSKSKGKGKSKSQTHTEDAAAKYTLLPSSSSRRSTGPRRMRTTSLRAALKP